MFTISEAFYHKWIKQQDYIMSSSTFSSSLSQTTLNIFHRTIFNDLYEKLSGLKALEVVPC